MDAQRRHQEGGIDGVNSVRVRRWGRRARRGQSVDAEGDVNTQDDVDRTCARLEPSATNEMAADDSKNCMNGGTHRKSERIPERRGRRGGPKTSSAGR